MTSPSRTPRSRLASVVGALLVVTLTGCTTGSSDDPGSTASVSAAPQPEPAAYHRYVALGDSYSAGPLIPTTDLAGGCARSSHNYPSLLAKGLRVPVLDVTCSAATTRDLTHAQRSFGGARIPPQLRSVTPRTDLVTVGIGGNDLGLFSTLVTACTRLRAIDPNGSPCARRLAARGLDLGATTATISDRVTGSLRAIRRRAPRATVVLVGYLRLVPDHGTCARLPLARGDYAQGRRISAALDRALARAAHRAEVVYVDMYAVSHGHDICSAHPWVNGRVTDQRRALAYHPLAAGMRADARAVLAALR